MGENKYNRWIILLAVLGIIVALYLVINELVTPRFCPLYPIIGIPACYLVTAFFITAFLSLYIEKAKTSLILYYTACLAGLATALWFSSNQILGNTECPKLLGIPLCFVALLTFLALLILAYLGNSKNS